MSTIDIKLCIGTISDPAMAKQSLQTHSKPLERKDEFVANAIWRYLTIRGYVLFPPSSTHIAYDLSIFVGTSAPFVSVELGAADRQVHQWYRPHIIDGRSSPARCPRSIKDQRQIPRTLDYDHRAIEVWSAPRIVHRRRISIGWTCRGR
jgi:hypothetical protein